MPRCSLECWKSCLKSPDVFEHKQLHRYQNNSEYKNVCGGISSGPGYPMGTMLHAHEYPKYPGVQHKVRKDNRYGII